MQDMVKLLLHPHFRPQASRVRVISDTGFSDALLAQCGANARTVAATL